MGTKASDTTKSLVEALVLDTWPTPGACCDFGIDPSGRDVEVYGALQYGFKCDVFSEADLLDASCDGEKVTALVAKAVEAGSCYGRGVVVRTFWDGTKEED